MKASNGWPTVKLGEHVELLTGFPFKSQRFSTDPNDTPLVKGENVAQGRIEWEISKRWPADELDQFDQYRLRNGDVVLAMDRPWIEAGLKYAWIKPHDPVALLVQRVSRLRGRRTLDQTFLRYIIGSPAFTHYIRPIVTGVNVPHISPQQIKDFQFGLPPVSFQRKAAAILSAYDDLVENNTRRIQVLERMAQALYREWFVHFRFPGHAKVKRVASPLGPIPQGWEAATFSKVADIARGSINPAQFPDERFWHYSIPAFDAGRMPPLERGDSILSNKFLLQADCVMLAKLNPRIPRIWLPRLDGEHRAVASTEFLPLMPRSGFTLPFVYSLCCSDEFLSVFAGRALGTSTSHQRVKPDDLMQLPVVLPTPSRVEAFTEHVEPMFAFIHNLRSKNANLRRSRDLLLPKLISGSLDVSKLRIETA